MTTPTTVNAPNLNVDGNPAVTALADGRAAIAYQSRRADGEFDIVMRIREADGTLGPEYRSDGDWSLARNADLETLNDGTLILSWLARTGSESNPQSTVLAQRISGDGVPLNQVLTLAKRDESDVRFLDQHIAADPDGGYALTVQSAVGNSQDVFFSSTSFSQNGPTALTEQIGGILIPLDGDTAGQFLPGREDVFVSTSYNSGRGGYDDIEALRLTGDTVIAVGDGGPATLSSVSVPSSFIRSYDVGAYQNPAFYSPLHVSFLKNPGFLYDNFFERDRDGDPIPVIEDSLSDSPQSFSVSGLSDGGFVVTWATEGSIRAQLFDEDGSHVGDNYTVAVTAVNDPRPVAAEAGDDELIFVWQDRPGDDLEVVSQMVLREDLSVGTFEQDRLPFLAASGRIVGDPVQGETYRVTGSIDSNERIVDRSLQWYRLDNDGPRAIEGANGLTYELSSDDVGKRIYFEAIVENAGGQVAVRRLEYKENGRVQPIENVQDPAEGDIRIDGEPIPGEVLTALPEITDADGIPEDETFFLQWFRDGEQIEGAFEAEYMVDDKDLGTNLTVEVRFRDAYDVEERIESDDILIRAAPTDGADILIGGSRPDDIDGLAGNDRIDGGLGSDTLRGDAGEDIFVFARDYGVDVIEDFTPGTDRVEFDFEGIGRIKELLRAASVSQVGDDVRIDLGDDDVLILRDVDKGDLTPADALFV